MRKLVFVLSLLITGCSDLSDGVDKVKADRATASKTCLDVCPRGVESMSVEYYNLKCTCRQ